MAKIYKSINLNSDGQDKKDILVSENDSIAGFLEEKVVAGSTKISIQTLNEGVDEDLQIDVDQSQVDHDQLLNYEVDEHRALDDASTTATSLWSSNKIQTELDTKINNSEKGAVNGVATLDGSGKVPASQMQVSLMEFQGSWNGATNTPTLANTDSGANGNVYRVGTGGTVDFGAGNITFETDDWVYNDGTEWAKLDGVDPASTDQVPEGSLNFYYTEGRVSANTDVAANTAARHDAITLNAGDATQQSANLSGQELELVQATSSTDGVMSAEDKSKLDGVEAGATAGLPSLPENNFWLGATGVATETNFDTKSGQAESFRSVTNHNDISDAGSGQVITTAERSKLSGIEDNATADQNAGEVVYTNTTSGLTATDVQAAIDEVEGRVDTLEGTSDGDELVKVSSNDTTAGYLEDKIVVAEGANTSTILEVNTLNDAGNEDVQIRIDEAKIDHDALLNFASNEHVDHSSVNINTNAESGLTGGGDITTSRTLSVDITGTTEETSVATDDEVLIYDTSNTVLKKTTVANLVANVTTSQTNFTFSDNQSSAADVTGFLFNSTNVSSFYSQVSVSRDATFEAFNILGSKLSGDWSISVESIGDDTGVEFSITSAGQIQYTSTNTGSGGNISFKSETIDIETAPPVSGFNWSSVGTGTLTVNSSTEIIMGPNQSSATYFSDETLSGDGSVEFTFSGVSEQVTGPDLNFALQSTTPTVDQIDFEVTDVGIYLEKRSSPSRIYKIESNVAGSPIDNFVTPLTSSTVYKLERVSGTVNLYVDDMLMVSTSGTFNSNMHFVIVPLTTVEGNHTLNITEITGTWA